MSKMSDLKLKQQEDLDLKEGDKVKYWRGIKDGCPSGVAEITDFASIGGTDCVFLEDVRGAIAVSHIEKVESNPDMHKYPVDMLDPA